VGIRTGDGQGLSPLAQSNHRQVGVLLPGAGGALLLGLYSLQRQPGFYNLPS